MPRKRSSVREAKPGRARLRPEPVAPDRDQRNTAGLEAVQTILMDTVHTVEKVFGSRHPHLATAYENLAASLRRFGHIDDANKAEARALQIRNGLLVERRGTQRVDDPRGALGRLNRREPAQSRVGVAVLPVAGAARYLGISPDTLYGLVRSGEIPHSRVGKSIRFRIWDLDRFLEERTTRRWERLDGRGRPRRR